MRATRGATGLCGILPVDKPAGMTSHDVVAAVRRLTGERRIGHAGTLDPAATGLLVVLVGPATRLSRYLLTERKSYRATVAFGSETDTHDADGEVVATAEVPSSVRDVAHARTCVASLVGRHMQVPPAHSALKVGGRKAYELARAGRQPQLAAREVEVSSASLVDVDRDIPAWVLDLTVSKGTYVRALARDLGRSQGSVAHLADLRRTSSGRLTVDEAVPLADLTTESIAGAFVDSVYAMGLPPIHVDPSTMASVSDGRPFEATGAHDRVAVVGDDRLIAVYVRHSDSFVPEVVLPGGCT
jgi:tRNA pseudouridine55 synthase